MSAKRKADPADVLVNKLNVGLAKHKRLLASWSGLPPPSSSAGSAVENNDDDDDFKDEALGYEQLGIGGKIPKDIQDGSFTRRTLTSNDKLLQQLMGKKAAKAHIAARQNPGEAGKPKKFEPAPKPESEDEEEGRAATFKSKRRKIARTPKVEDDETNSTQAVGAEIPLRPAGIEGDAETTSAAKASPKDDSDAEEPPTKSKRKGGSYLDELLAERSKKQKNKKKKQEAKV